MPEVPRQNTPASLEDLGDRLARQRLSSRQRCFLLAHIAIETAQGRSIQNFNVGNLTVSRAQLTSVPFWRPPWFELDETSTPRERELHQLMLEGKEPSAFRAYGSLDEGVSDYVRRLRQRFPSLLRASSPALFVKAWKESGYTPRLNVARTLPNFKALVRSFRCSSGGPSLLLMAAAGAGAYYLWRRYAATLPG